MASADEIVNQELAKRQAVDSKKPTGTLVVADTQKPDETPQVKDIAKVAGEAIVDKVKTGGMTIDEAAKGMVKAAATVKAANDNADEYAEIAGKALTHEMKADSAEARSKERRAGNEDNEAFYERFRPILEFDFGNITGKPKQRTEGAETRSYSKFFMILTITVAALPWLVIALILYLLKGINATVELIREFTKIAQVFIWTGLGLLLAYILLNIVAYYIEFYTGIQILPF